MTRLTDSGSSRSCSAVEPIRSAKTIVTTLRATVSPALVAALSAVTPRPASETPQLRQNLAVGAHGLPHDGQRRSSRAPHSSQNAEPSGFSLLHVEQFIGESSDQPMIGPERAYPALPCVSMLPCRTREPRLESWA